MPSTGAPPRQIGWLDLIALHDAVANIAAVTWNHVFGSAGVVVPPAGYWRRLRDIRTNNTRFC